MASESQKNWFQKRIVSLILYSYNVAVILHHNSARSSIWMRNWHFTLTEKLKLNVLKHCTEYGLKY